MRRAAPDVVYSTMAQASLSHLTLGRPYRYQGRPGWPFDPASHDTGAVTQPARGGDPALKTAARLERIREFTAARAEGLTVREAGERVDVEPKTARTYERERLAMDRQQRGERRDG